MAAFQACGAIRDGHFLLSSGRHSDRYVQCAAVLEDPRRAEEVAQTILAKIDAAFDRVLAAPMGGLLIGHEVARAAGTRFIFPERDSEGRFRFRRGFALKPGERICVIEDVITTGRTTHELIRLVGEAAAEMVGLGAIVDRSVAHEIGGHPIHAALVIQIATYEPDACPLCDAGVELTKPGSRPRTGGEIG
jgi:orotate phosphoribosyltransferase